MVEKYHAVIFDLLTALLNSWSLWNQVAGSEGVGFDWRTRYLQLTYHAGPYRSYEGIIKEAAHEVGVSAGRADELIQRSSPRKRRDTINPIRTLTVWRCTGCNAQRSPCSLSPALLPMCQGPPPWGCRSFGTIAGA
jgi:hypothetical protein